VAATSMSGACAPSNLAGSSPTDLLGGAACDALHPPTDPDLLALDPAERAAFAAVRGQGIAVVHYEQKGCDIRLELLNNCLAQGQYQFVPYWEQQTKSAKDANELFAKLPVGALSVASKLSGQRALRADYMLAGMAQLPIGYNVDPSQLVGDCGRATHIVTRMYLGGFTLAAGESQELAAQTSVFVEVGATSKSSLERVRYAGDPKSCEDSRRTRSENIGCSAPLRLVLLPLAEMRECIGPAECQARCDAGGENFSCVNLGGMYLNGNGVPADPARAARLFQQACDHGDMTGCGNLGAQFFYGNGIPQDFRRASSLLFRACGAGVSWSCTALGQMNARGAGVPVDLLRAASLYQSGCAGGDKPACEAAVTVLTQVCDAGDENGCWQLGTMYAKGEGVQTDQRRGAALIQKSCDKGMVDACMELGTLYMRGFGVTQDTARGLEIYKRYCNGLQVNGCLALGWAYFTGDGVAKHMGQAFSYFERACDAGEQMGCGGMAQMFLEGRGVKADYDRALKLFRDGCDANCGACCSGVADIYETGKGVRADLGQARMFYGQACKLGDEESCRAVERLNTH
jgi:TPR repeat protein